MNVAFTQTGRNYYVFWQTQDKKTVKKINQLIKSSESNGPLKGQGHPKFLKYIKAYSRPIDEKNKLVYQYRKPDIIVLACQAHYED